MKKSILLLAVIILTTSVFAQTSGIKLDNLTRNDYTITGTITGSSKSNRIWILFIPIGGRSDTKRKDQAYKAALKTCGCDGIIQPVYTEKRAVIPLILISYSHHLTTVSGKGYRIKTDADILNPTESVPATAMPIQPIITKPTMSNGFSVGDKITFMFKGKVTDGTILWFKSDGRADVEFIKRSGKRSEIRKFPIEMTKK